MKQFLGPARLTWLFVLFAVGLAVYSAGLGIQYYSDDFQFLYLPVSSSYVYWFLHRNPSVAYAYRPLEASVLLFVQSHFGLLNTVPIHLVALGLHAMLAWAVYLFMTKEGFGKIPAVVASLFMLLSQANAHAVLSNDTLSQIMGTLFGCLGLWLLYRYYETGGKLKPAYPMSVGLFFLSLLSKETSFGFLLMMVGLIGFREFKRGDEQGRVYRALLPCVPFLALTLVYLGLRAYVGTQRPKFGVGEGDFAVGFNVVKNLGLFALASFDPVSTAQVYLAAKSRDLVTVAFTLAATLIFLAMLLYGLSRSPERGKTIWAMAGLTLAGLFPALLMAHVSELYLYNSMPFISILVGMGIGRYFEGESLRVPVRILGGTFLILLLVVNITGVQNKAHLMKQNGEKAAVLLHRIPAYSSTLPTGGTLVLLNPTYAQPRYSVFLLNGFEVLKFASRRIKAVSRRPDLRVRILQGEDWGEERQAFEGRPDTLILTLKGNEVVRYHGDAGGS